MADTYPAIGVKAWAALRAKAASSPTTKFTPSVVAALLEMKNAKSAQDNIVSPLRKLGIIDENGALTAVGNKWRVDETYPDAMKQLAAEIFPTDLAALTDADGKPDGAKVVTWLKQSGLGDSSASQAARTYVMLASGDIPPPPENGSTKTPKKASAGTPKSSPASPRGVPGAAVAPPPSPQADVKGGPSLHVDVQIHIDPAASSAQIDQIFASLAKHFPQR